METPCSLLRLPPRACRLQRAIEAWRRALVLVRLFVRLRRRPGRGRHGQAPAVAARRASPRRRVVLHLRRTVVLDEMEAPPSHRLPAASPPRPPHANQESRHEKLPPQQP